MDVVGAYIAQVDAIDARRHLHIAPHARHGLDVLDPARDLEDAAAVAHAERFHGRRYGEADGRIAARGVGYHELGEERVEPSVDAFDRGVERLEVDAQVGALTIALPCFGHGASLAVPFDS